MEEFAVGLHKNYRPSYPLGLLKRDLHALEIGKRANLDRWPKIEEETRPSKKSDAAMDEHDEKWNPYAFGLGRRKKGAPYAFRLGKQKGVWCLTEKGLVRF